MSQIVLHIQKSANHLKLLMIERLDLDDLGSIQFCDLLRWMKQNCQETQKLLDVFTIQTADYGKFDADDFLPLLS